jgi:methylenetetrahydrofolate dehydrogenase (NADP+)/methenyltetrahydrofolate cyclohydrolase
MNEESGTRIMDGAALAKEILASVAQRASAISREIGRPPCLAAVLVGDDPSSATYVRMKQKRCASVGVDSRIITLPHSSHTTEVVDTICRLCADDSVDGILL